MARVAIAAMAVAICIAAAGPAAAEEPGSRQMREFVQAAAESDAFEITEAEAALAQSRDPQVLSFARQMIEDHGRTCKALMAAAMQAGIKPPVMAVGAGQAPFLATLQSARGAEFDRIYWHQQALAHRAELVVEQAYAASGDAAAVRQVATAAVPIIAAHLAMAERMSAGTTGS